MPQLIVPGLFQPLRLWRSDFAFEPIAPSLLRLCAGARRVAVPVQGLENTLFNALGHSAHAAVPFAYYRYCLDFGTPPLQPLACADPVWMRSGVDQVTLNAELPRLDAASAMQLQALLNTHLAADGLTLVGKHPQRWYVLGDALAGETAPRTVALSQARGQSIFPLLPQGNHRYWHRLLNEIQMLLYDKSEAVNGLWLWGVSNPAALAPLLGAEQGGFIGTSVTAEVMAVATQTPHQAATTLAASDLSGNPCIILEHLLPLAAADDLHGWQAALSVLETNWFAPLLAGAQAGKFSVSLSACDGRVWQCQPAPRWQFWRNRRATWEQLT